MARTVPPHPRNPRDQDTVLAPVSTRPVPTSFGDAPKIETNVAPRKRLEPETSFQPDRTIALTPPVNVASVPQRSPFRYPGGKTWLVPHIRSWLARKTHRVDVLIEPFAGGGIVGLTAAFEGLAQHVVLVERDPHVAAVWQTILGGDAPWLADQILHFDLNRTAVRQIFGQEPRTQRERAFATLLRNRVQRGGILAPGAGLLKNGENGRGLRSRWYPETLARRIADIAGMRARFTFIAGDGHAVIRRYAAEANTAFFVDPPYTVAGRRLYAYWQVDHRQLFGLLAGVKGDVLMTCDSTPTIAALAQEFRFETAPVAMKNAHHAKRTELLVAKDLSWRAEVVNEAEAETGNEERAFPA